MLHAADSLVASDCADTADLPSPKTAHRQRPDAQPLTEARGVSGGRYGDQRRLSAPALCLTISVHLLVIALLLGMRHHVEQYQEQRLVSINLSPPPPPPAAEAPSQPKPPTPTIPAPHPLLEITPPQQVTIPVAIDPQPAAPTVEPVSIPSSAPPSRALASLIQGGDLGTRMVSGKPPRYPIESRRKKEQGTVVLSLILGFDGAVEQISVSRSSGFERLDDAALDAVRKWRWEPVMRGGQPVKVRGIVEIPFVLKG